MEFSGEKNLDAVREDLHGLIARAISFIGVKKTLLTAIAVFLTHFFISWTYSLPYVTLDTTYVIIHPYLVFIERGLEAVSSQVFQVNIYTGSPFFLYGVFNLVDLSPEIIRLSIITMMASSSAVFFLVYQEVMDFKYALVSTIFLLSFPKWLLFRWPEDYAWTTLFIGLTVYLYLKWSDHEDFYNKYLYILSFFLGIFFYFKAVIAYLAVSLGFGELYDFDFANLIDYRFLIIVALFLIGSTPFWFYVAHHTDSLYSHGVGDQSLVRDNGDISFAENIGERANQLDNFVRSGLFTDAENIDISGISQIKYKSTGLSILTVLLSVLFVSTKSLRDGYSIEAKVCVFSIVFFILTAFVPGTSDLRPSQMSWVAPFIPLIIFTASKLFVEEIMERYELEELMRTLSYIAVILAVAGFVLMADNLEKPEGPEEDALELYRWAGDQAMYESLQSEGIHGQTVTNSFRVYMTELYRTDRPYPLFLLPENATDEKIEEKNFGGGWPPSVVNRKPLGEWSYRENTTLVLRDDLPCSWEKSFCGAEKDRIMEKMEGKSHQFRTKSINGIEFTILRTEQDRDKIRE